MISILNLLTLSDDYARFTKVGEKTVSSRVFGDGKKMGALRRGADITVSRYNLALQWFSNNWPDGVEWPAAVNRPAPEKLEAAE